MTVKADILRNICDGILCDLGDVPVTPENNRICKAGYLQGQRDLIEKAKGKAFPENAVDDGSRNLVFIKDLETLIEDKI